MKTLRICLWFVLLFVAMTTAPAALAARYPVERGPFPARCIIGRDLAADQ